MFTAMDDPNAGQAFVEAGASAVSPDYGPGGNESNGAINWVQTDLEKDDHDHLISHDERFRIAMAQQ